MIAGGMASFRGARIAEAVAGDAPVGTVCKLVDSCHNRRLKTTASVAA